MTTIMRRGVTLLELLVVLAIIGIFLQMLLPKIDASREAARQAVCQNNLRQIGLAMQNHEAILHYLPTAGWGWAWMADPDRGVGKDQSGSWSYQLLPYMEANDIHDIGRGTTDDAKYDALAVLASTILPTLYCPSRRLPRATPNNYGPVNISEFRRGDLFWYNAYKAETLARTDYSANVGDTWVFWAEGPPPAIADKGEGFLEFKGVNQASVTIEAVTGVVVQRQPFCFRQITDGTSNTYFAGDKSLAVLDYRTGRGPNDDQSCWNGDDWDQVCSTEFPPRKDPAEPAPGFSAAFGSAHPHGFNMVFCDGSVRFISYEVDAKIHRQFGNRHDGAGAAQPNP